MRTMSLAAIFLAAPTVWFLSTAAGAPQTPAPPIQDQCQSTAICMCDYTQDVNDGADSCPNEFSSVVFEHADGDGFNGCCDVSTCTDRNCVATTSFTGNVSPAVQICIKPPGGDRTCTTSTSMMQDVNFNEECGSGKKTYKVWVGGKQCKNVDFECHDC